ncbi:hypothetical protein ANN_24830 [Periplaneta americana]|uniref:Uncharacterized protein n=1 Tax=Periplaneta americana TaxID=6978 RepID=A0ABQ8RZP1_PERAM|nr:hypothetical protein ANN_24830 [Periplaneta americana]
MFHELTDHPLETEIRETTAGSDLTNSAVPASSAVEQTVNSHSESTISVMSLSSEIDEIFNTSITLKFSVPVTPKPSTSSAGEPKLSNQPCSKKHAVEELAASYGHVVLRFPPYHCVLNPLGMLNVMFYLTTLATAEVISASPVCRNFIPQEFFYMPCVNFCVMELQQSVLIIGPPVFNMKLKRSTTGTVTKGDL